jgi:protein-S-isoprenylcysteine O-methyltransferase Ste14
MARRLRQIASEGDSHLADNSPGLAVWLLKKGDRAVLRKIMPTTYLLLAMLLIITLHFIIPIRTVVPPGWNLLGIAPLLFGIWINLAADQALRRAKTTVKPFEPNTALIQDGVFHLTRNPMYLGFVAILLGLSILLRSLSPYLVLIAFAVWLDFAFIRAEERKLEASFGEAWIHYSLRVRRWI